jgi:hypothetical protein
MTMFKTATDPRLLTGRNSITVGNASPGIPPTAKLVMQRRKTINGKEFERLEQILSNPTQLMQRP